MFNLTGLFPLPSYAESLLVYFFSSLGSLLSSFGLGGPAFLREFKVLCSLRASFCKKDKDILVYSLSSYKCSRTL